VLAGGDSLRRCGHPAGAHLVIEVALSSRDRDLTLKPGELLDSI
jgi:hypothetical protein